MVDIQPSAIAATTSSASGAAPASPTPALTSVQVTIADISQALENLTRVIQTGATAAAVNPNGDVTLSTVFGNITVNLAQQLSAAEKQNLNQILLNMVQTQKPLTLTLQPGSPPTQGALLIPATPAQNIEPVPPQAQPPMPLSPPQAIALAPGQTVAAIILPALPPNPQPQPPANLAALLEPAASSLVPQTSIDAPNTGTVTPAFFVSAPNSVPSTSAAPTLTLPTASPETSIAPSLQNIPQPVQTPAIATQQQQTTQSLPTQIAPTPQAVATTTLPQPNPAPSLAALLQPGNEVSLHIDTILPPNQPLPPLAANQIAATITGVGTNGQLILKAGDTTLFVKSPVTTPIGTNVIVTVGTAKLSPLLTLPSPQNANFDMLRQAVAALAQTNPQVLQALLSNPLPQPNEALPGALLLLFNAFRQGNVREWLGGEATETLLRAGKSDIVAGLSRELANAGQPAQDAVVGEWKSYPIPLYAQQQFQALTLFVHGDRDARQQDHGGKAGAPGKVRFLIDMRLSKLGAMQIDGFVQNKQLDMILRSEANLPEGLHQNLRLSYIKALGAVGYAGALNFQVGRHHWLTMQQAAPPGIVT